MRFKVIAFGTPGPAHCRARNDSRVKEIRRKGNGKLVDRNPNVVIHRNSDRNIDRNSCTGTVTIRGPFTMPAK